MGRCKIDYEKNRCLKIARNKKKRKNKKHNPFAPILKHNPKFQIKDRVVKTIFNNNFFTKIVKKHGEAIITIPKIFCIVENPSISLIILKQISKAIFDNNVNSIYFDYSNCETLGLDASLVTDIIVLRGKALRNKMGIKTKLAGNFPKSVRAKEIFLNSGLIKHLGISKVESPHVKRLDPFLYEKNPNLMTNKVINYYNSCLSTSGFVLNDKGINYFNNLVGEIIDNAEQHSGKYGEWFVSGHFSHDNNIEKIPKGRLTFISFGNTIYESLKNDTVDDFIKNKLEKQTKYHKKLFDFSWNEESSWTVFALQWMISRKKTQFNDRGTGTIKFIDSFTELGKTINNEIPKMAILSGHTHILFDGTYTLKEQTTHRNTKVKVIAFNKSNNLRQKPDSKYVKLLNSKFPGVIISCDFYVDKAYLTKIKEEKNEKGN